MENHFLNRDNVCAIDTGVNNIIIMVNSIGKQPIVIKGGIIKSINQYYNKIRKKYMSIKDKQNYSHWTNQLKKLDLNRYNKLENCFHHISKKLVKYWIDNNIGTVVIGYNHGWKQKSNMGKRNNQNFVSIPFWQFIKKVMYKAYLVGIEVYLISESHTPKCRFLDNESIEHHDKYKGRRIYRGLFRASSGRIINADVNAAYNIMKKAISNAILADETEDIGLHPRSISILRDRRK